MVVNKEKKPIYTNPYIWLCIGCFFLGVALAEVVWIIMLLSGVSLAGWFIYKQNQEKNKENRKIYK